jgi:hypothetical protein
VVYSDMKAPVIGPMTGPSKGAKVYIPTACLVDLHSNNRCTKAHKLARVTFIDKVKY